MTQTIVPSDKIRPVMKWRSFMNELKKEEKITPASGLALAHKEIEMQILLQQAFWGKEAFFVWACVYTAPSSQQPFFELQPFPLPFFFPMHWGRLVCSKYVAFLFHLIWKIKCQTVSNYKKCIGILLYCLLHSGSNLNFNVVTRLSYLIRSGIKN